MIDLASLTHSFDAPKNSLYRMRDGFLEKGKGFVDLASGNVNSQGIDFPPDILKKAYTEALQKTKIYKPDPLGHIETRHMVSDYYSAAGLKIPTGHIVITPGTSISYWYAFKTLADPGDEILSPSPSYPLFESIAQLSGVKLVPYRLRETRRWEIDMQGIESASTPRTRAIILISPHIPTGAVAT